MSTLALAPVPARVRRAARVLAPLVLGLGALALGSCAGPEPHRPEHDPALLAVLHHQTAAESRGQCVQTYRGAAQLLERALADPTWSAALEQRDGYADLPPAVILDVDETVLDNSPYQARVVETGVGYPEGWAAWCEEARAEPIPGALEFCRAAAQLGVTVVYLTNRDAPLEAATRRNLGALGFPLDNGVRGAGEDLVLMRGEREEWGSDKGSRRAHVAQHYRVLMLFGDNLGDFVGRAGEARGTRAERERVVRRHEARLGTTWFLLPNAMYGYWLDALIDYDFDLTPEQVAARRVGALEPGR